MNYKGIFTLQTARGKEGLELDTIKEHKKIFEKLFKGRFILVYLSFRPRNE